MRTALDEMEDIAQGFRSLSETMAKTTKAFREFSAVLGSDEIVAAFEEMKKEYSSSCWWELSPAALLKIHLHGSLAPMVFLFVMLLVFLLVGLLL